MILDKYLLKDPSVKRHLLKTITWRLLGTMDTIVIGWFISGSMEFGLKIGGLEIITKMTLYFIHERIWYRINFGLPNRHKQLK